MLNLLRPAGTAGTGRDWRGWRLHPLFHVLLVEWLALCWWRVWRGRRLLPQRRRLENLGRRRVWRGRRLRCPCSNLLFRIGLDRGFLEEVLLVCKWFLGAAEEAPASRLHDCGEGCGRVRRVLAGSTTKHHHVVLIHFESTWSSAFDLWWCLSLKGFRSITYSMNLLLLLLMFSWTFFYCCFLCSRELICLLLLRFSWTYSLLLLLVFS